MGNEFVPNGDFYWHTVETKIDKQVLERALDLADTVSYEIWGGTRGWERATDEQFQTLLKRLKEKLRANSDERVAPVRREERVPGERVSTGDRDSQPVDNHDLDQTERNT